MGSRNASSRFLQRNFSMPEESSQSSSWFRERTKSPWSPKSDDSDPDFDSDEENAAALTGDYPMSSPESSDNAQTPNFVMNKPLLSEVISSSSPVLNRAQSHESSRGAEKGSSRSLQIGKSRSIGLKDIDLTNNPRAAQIRNAKKANRKHIFSPLRQNSSPAVLSGEHQDIRYQGTSYGPGSNIVSSARSYSVAIVPYNGGSTIHSRNPYGNRSSSDVCTSQSAGRSVNSSGTGRSIPYSVSTSRSVSKPKRPIVIYSQFYTEASSPTKSDFDTSSKKKDVIEIPDDDEGDGNVKNIDDPPQSKMNGVNNPRTQEADNWSIGFRKRNSKVMAKRSTSSIGFSDDEDDEQTFTKKRENPQPIHTPSKTENSPKRKRSYSCSSILFTVVLSVLAASLYLYLNPHSLCLEGEFKANLTGLEKSLHDEFYGQHLAKKVLLSSLKSHLKGTSNKPLVLSLHGWTGTGKNYATGIIAQHLFKRGEHSNFIHKFIIPLHFPHQSLVPLYRTQLHSWITGNVSQCSKGGLFIFDEMDKIPHGIVDVLKPFLDSRGNHVRRMIFIFLSNTGAKVINHHVLEHYQRGEARDKIGLVALEGALHKIAESDTSTWFSELLKSELIDHFVPFLPLERGHVKQCIRKDLRSKGLDAEENMVTAVADEMMYFPQAVQLFSVSGCKKVSSKVDVAVG